VIVLGLILIVLAVAAGALLFVATQPLTEPVELEALGVQATVLPLVLLIAGAAVMLLLWLGLVLIRGSVRRKTRRRREAKELERQAQQEAEARRAAEARAEEARATAPVPAARYADTRARPGDGWADDTPAGRHAAPVGATSAGATRVDERPVADDTRTMTDARTTSSTGPDSTGSDSTKADQVMGRDDHESGRR
jgi:hypothetical protein